MHKVDQFYLLLFSFLIGLSGSSCTREEFTTDPAAQLRFELDTLTFDTVFTTIGSATRSFKIYNPGKKSIEINSIEIPSGLSSDFRLNADGLPGPLVRGIEIGPEDSVYVFCEVKVNPFDPLEISPFIKTDSIIISYNNNRNVVQLIAWGQNANYIPSKLNKGMVSFIDLQGSKLIWDDLKPYIVYGIVYIDNGELEIAAGSKIHFWGGLTKATNAQGETFFYNDGRLIIGPGARLVVRGTKNDPVIFQGVRLEEFFRDIPGQWSGIFIDQMSRGNVIDYAEIKNNLIGVYADSTSQLTISNTIISNNSLYGIYSRSSALVLDNSLLYNQGSSALYVSTGGQVECNYTDFVSLGNTEPSVYISNAECIDFPFCEIIYTLDLDAKFTNCIITGSNQDEFWYLKDDKARFNLVMKNTIFRSDELISLDPQFEVSYTIDCINQPNLNRLFVDAFRYDFHPDTLSILEGAAVPIVRINTDLDGNLRDPGKPDIGCYEYQY